MHYDRIVADDFIGADIPLTDKLNALYFLLDDIYKLSIAENFVPNKITSLFDNSTIVTILTARDWFSTFLKAFEKIDGDTYDFLENQT